VKRKKKKKTKKKQKEDNRKKKKKKNKKKNKKRTKKKKKKKKKQKKKKKKRKTELNDSVYGEHWACWPDPSTFQRGRVTKGIAPKTDWRDSDERVRVDCTATTEKCAKREDRDAGIKSVSVTTRDLLLHSLREKK